MSDLLQLVAVGRRVRLAHPVATSPTIRVPRHAARVEGPGADAGSGGGADAQHHVRGAHPAGARARRRDFAFAFGEAARFRVSVSRKREISPWCCGRFRARLLDLRADRFAVSVKEFCSPPAREISRTGDGLPANPPRSRYRMRLNIVNETREEVLSSRLGSRSNKDHTQ